MCRVCWVGSGGEQGNVEKQWQVIDNEALISRRCNYMKMIYNSTQPTLQIVITSVFTRFKTYHHQI